MGKLIRKATGLTVGVATLLAGLVLPMTASAESASPIDASPIIHYSFDNALTSKTIANEGSAANSDATLSGDATVANGQINLTGSQTISVPTTAIAGKKDVTVSIWLKNNYGNGNTAADTGKSGNQSSCEIAESRGQRRGSGCGISGLYLWTCKHHDGSDHECAKEEKDIRSDGTFVFFSVPFPDQIVSEWDDNA